MKFFAQSFFLKKTFPVSLLQLMGLQILLEALFYFGNKFQLISFFLWNFRSYDFRQEVILQALLFLCILANYYLKFSYQKPVMLFFSGILGFISIGYFIFYYFIIAAIPLFILRFGKEKHIQNIIIFCILYEALLFINFNYFFNHPGYEVMFYLASFFLMLYPIRFILFYKYWMRNPDDLQKEIMDYYLYFFFPPYFIIFPFVFILPGYQYQKDSFKPLKFHTFQNTYRYFYYGVLLYFSALIFAFIEKIEAPHSSLIMTVIWILKNYCCFSSFANFLTGLFHILGYDIKPAFDWPFLSSNLFEFFNRFMVYVKDFIMENFYLPMIIKLKFIQSIQLRMSIGLIGSLMLGSACLEFTMLGMNFCILFDPSLYGNNNTTSADMYVQYYQSEIRSWQDLHFYILNHISTYLQFSLFILGYAYFYKFLKSRFSFKNPAANYWTGFIINNLIFITLWYFGSL